MNGRIVAVGLSHHTAPVEVRERLAPGPTMVPSILSRLRLDHVGTEGVLLSTCNRVELYAILPRHMDPDALEDWLAERGGLAARLVRPHLYRHADQEALRHLFRVTSSLDSMVIGEPQILSQVKAAYQIAVESDATGPFLRRVMDRALTVAKRVRTETDIGREAVSVGRAGVELARQVLGTLKGRVGLLIGAGAHGKLVARSLQSHGLGELVVANRTFERGAALAKQLGATAAQMVDLPRHLERADVVITSTGAGEILIHKRDLAPIMRKRRYQSLVMIDLSVPRNIDPEIQKLDGVYSFDVDDLRQLADQGLDKRKEAAHAAERIIEEETAQLWRFLMGESAREQIGAAAREAERIRQAEVERAKTSLGELDPAQRVAVEAMTRAIVKKMLHQPLKAIRQRAETGDQAGLEVLLDAFVHPTGEGAPPNGPPKGGRGVDR